MAYFDLKEHDMVGITTRSVSKWVTIGMTLLLIASLAMWWIGRQTVPRRIQIATGPNKGLYYEIGLKIRETLERRLHRSVDVIKTDGSKSNFELLRNGEADLAIVQGGSGPIEEFSVITPLFRELVFVIARKGSSINNVWDLQGRRVCLGPEGSGNRDSALKVLKHYRLDEGDLNGPHDLHFSALLNDDSMDAAIVTAGIEHPELRELLSTHEFDILPIRSAMALELLQPFARNVEVPLGLFAQHPPLPPEGIPTISTTAYLICREDANDDLVRAALETIHEESLRLKVPTLIARGDATKWTATRLHSTAQRYFNPEDNIGVMVNVMESIVATKELLFAIGAGIYLLWIRWRRLKEKEQEVIVHQQKERLDSFLTETLRIETLQSQTTNCDQLKQYLDQVTHIKQQALKELSEEELRGNQEFSIFLDQCSNLIANIQMKLLSARMLREKA